MKHPAVALLAALSFLGACNGSPHKGAAGGSGGQGGDEPGGSGGEVAPGGKGGGAGGSAGGGGGMTAAPDAGAAGGTGGGAGGAGGAGAATAGPDTTVTAFKETYVYFTAGVNGGPSDNKRTQNVTVKFPALPLAYDKITLNVSLSCPPATTGPCDAYDRRGHLGIVRTVNGKETVTELLRFMTPFGWPSKWTADVTALRPLLSGDVTLQIFIDTWVGPTSPAGQGRGWVIDASFDMKGGLPARLPIAVIPLWDATSVEYGNPMAPPAATVTPQMVKIPEGATAVELRALITGHGQGNLGNCSEFCRREHGFAVGDAQVRRQIWRPDCAQTAVHNPDPRTTKSWMYARAGWCPGNDVAPWVEDVTAGAAAGSTVMVAYDVAPYENTCRPDAPMCGGCSLGNGCEFDSGLHTKPVFVLSAALIVYGR
jgi:hypothetical protein